MSEHKHSLRVALVWKGSVFRERTFSQTSEQVISVGEANGATFRTPAPEFDGNFEMFERTDRGYVVRFTDHIDGTVTLGGEEYSLEELADDNRADAVGRMATAEGGVTIYEFEMVRGDWGLIELGDGEVFFQVLRQPAAVAGRGFDSLDVPVMAMALLAGIAHLLFLLIASLSYTIQPTLEQTVPRQDKFVLIDPVTEPEPDNEEKSEKPEPEPATESGAAPAVGGEKGEVGKKESDQEKTEGSAEKTKAAKASTTPLHEKGVLGELSGQKKGGPLGDIFRNSKKFNEQLSAKFEGESGETQLGRGDGGFSMRGIKNGGGGFGDQGTIGGMPSGTGEGVGPGGPGGGVPEKNKSKEIEIRTDDIKPGSRFCDANQIQSKIASNMNSVRYCYSKELQANPKLSGKVEIRFKIGMDGKVSSAGIASSTMNHAGVEGCLKRTIRRMTFEKPEGGVCVIKYPFVFSSPMK